MKNFKRALCMVLSLFFVLQLFVGCSSEQTDETIYLTKGEFFAYFVYENEMSSEKYTAEEIFNSYDGAIEADVIVEWGYLPEELAKNDLEDPVTKEIVVMACANSTFELKKGNTADIKDAGLLENPQLIADAYASGFFELENGYFDGAEKMSFADCEKVMEKAKEYMAGFHYEANKEITEIAEGVLEQDTTDYKEGDIVIEIIPADAQEEKSIASTGNAELKPSTMASVDSVEKSTINLANGAPDLGLGNQGTGLPTQTPKGFIATIAKKTFEKQLGNPKLGDVVVVKAFEIIGQPITQTGEVMGILMEKKLIGDKYTCIFEYPASFEQAVEKKNVKQGNGSGIDKATFVEEKTEVAGWSLEFDVTGSSIKVSAKKDFKSYETGRKQDWQNATKTVTATADLEMSNFNLDVKNLKSFANKKGTGFIKVTCDTNTGFSLSQSLRYTPDSNRNGKFPSNWSNSRWTDSDAKGAKTIKIARFSPTLYGVVTIDVYVYMLITVDGKVSFTTSIDDGGVMISAKEGKISTQKLGKKTSEFSANVNLRTRFGVEASLKIFTFIKVVTYDVGANLDLHAQVDLYYEDVLSKSGVYADEEGLNEYKEDDGKFSYCIDAMLELSVSGEMKSSGVKMILDYVNKGSSLDFEHKIWSAGLHFENGAFIDKCTHGDENEEEKLEETDDDVELSAYKISMCDNTCVEVLLKAIPSETANLMDSKNSITVKSKNNKVVKATYNKKRKAIILEAAGEGSTEIVITAKKGHLWWKKTATQEISVTVTSSN